MDLLALPAVSCDQSFAVQISHEENLLTTDTVYLQCALLYTSSAGVRRIRVHTMAAPVVADLGAMYKGADGAAMASVLSKIGEHFDELPISLHLPLKSPFLGHFQPSTSP